MEFLGKVVAGRSKVAGCPYTFLDTHTIDYYYYYRFIIIISLLLLLSVYYYYYQFIIISLLLLSGLINIGGKESALNWKQGGGWIGSKAEVNNDLIYNKYNNNQPLFGRTFDSFGKKGRRTEGIWNTARHCQLAAPTNVDHGWGRRKVPMEMPQDPKTPQKKQLN